MSSVGASDTIGTVRAVREAVERAQGGLREAPTWALALVGGRHPFEAAFAALQDALPGLPIFGGSAAGVITHDHLGYSGYDVGVALFDGPPPRVLRAEGLDRSERAVGQALGRGLEGTQAPVLLLYDSIRSGPPPVLNVGSYLLDGIGDAARGAGDLVGAGLLGDLDLTGSVLFDGARPVKQAALALALEGYESRTRIMHGCEPIGPPCKVTRIDGPHLFELDGRRALDVILETTGITLEQARAQLSLWVTLGAEIAPTDPGGSEDLEGRYVNRLVLSFDEVSGSVTLFEADFSEGTELQIMLRDNESMQRSAEAQARRLVAEAPEAELFLYIDCAGRCQAFSGSEVEEADLVRRVVPRERSLLGFYSGVEIAPLSGRSRPLDWTGVLTALWRR